MKPIHSLPCTLLVLLAGCAGSGPQGPEEPTVQVLDVQLPWAEALRITTDLVLPAGVHEVSGQEEGALVLEGVTGVTLDLRGVELLGAVEGTPPSAFAGRGVLIRGCRDVRVLGGALSGFRHAIWVEGSTNIVIEGTALEAAGSRLDGAGGPGLRGRGLEELLELEGAGLVVIDCSEVSVRALRCRGGAIGIAGLRTDQLWVEDADLSFLSARGVSLEKVTGSEVLGSRCEVIARGGAGAAAVHLGPGCEAVRVCGNLLRGGEAGGVDVEGRGNRWAWNDLSGSQRAGLEVLGGETIWIHENRVSSGQGIRLGGTKGALLVGNRLLGQQGAGLELDAAVGGVVANNRFQGGDLGLELRGGAVDTPVWVGGNHFEGNVQDLVLDRVPGVEVWINSYASTQPFVHLDGLSAPGTGADLEGRAAWQLLRDPEGRCPSGRAFDSRILPPRAEPPLELGRASGWAGPAGHSEVPVELDPVSELILGEHGPWDPTSGSPRPHAWSERGALDGVRWSATWFAWAEDSDPRGDLDRWRAARFEEPIRAEVTSWSDPWGGQQTVRDGLAGERFGLIATAELRLTAAGAYDLVARSDDGLRVRVDGETVLEDWSWHPARLERIRLELGAGTHEVELEYFQVDGAAVLELGLERAALRQP